MEKPLSQLYQTHTHTDMRLYTHAHRYRFIQVLFMGLAPLQGRDKGLEGENDRKNNQKKGEWLEY